MFNIFHCCGKTSKPVVKAIAVIDLLVAIGVALTGLIITAYFPDLMHLSNQQTGSEPVPVNTKLAGTPSVVCYIILAIFFFLEACLYTILQTATRERNIGLCDNWWKIRLILLCISIFGVIYCLSSSYRVEEIYIAGGVCIFVVLYRVYTLMAVKAFYLEILTSKQTDLGHALRIL